MHYFGNEVSIGVTLSGASIIFSVIFLAGNPNDLTASMAMGFWLGSFYCALSATIGMKLYLRRFSARKFEKLFLGKPEPLSENDLCLAMKVMPLKVIPFLVHAKKRLITVHANYNTYYYGHAALNTLANTIEEHLLENGNRDIYDIQSEITGKSLCGLFLGKALYVLIKKGVVIETPIGSNPDIEKSPEGYAYSHVNRPMLSNASPPEYDDAIDMDFD